MKTTIDLPEYNIVRACDDVNQLRYIISILNKKEQEMFKVTFFQDAANEDNLRCFEFLIDFYGLEWNENDLCGLLGLSTLGENNKVLNFLLNNNKYTDKNNIKKAIKTASNFGEIDTVFFLIEKFNLELSNDYAIDIFEILYEKCVVDNYKSSHFVQYLCKFALYIDTNLFNEKYKYSILKRNSTYYYEPFYNFILQGQKIKDF